MRKSAVVRDAMPKVTIDYGADSDRSGTKRLFSKLPFPMAEASSDEKEMLLPTSVKDERILLRAQRCSTILCFCVSALAVVTLTVMVVLSYLQVAKVVSDVDSTVGLRKTAVALLLNANDMLNNTAAMTSDAHSVTHSAAQSMTPRVSEFLTNLARITDNPTISIGNLGISSSSRSG